MFIDIGEQGEKQSVLEDKEIEKLNAICMLIVNILKF